MITTERAPTTTVTEQDGVTWSSVLTQDSDVALGVDWSAVERALVEREWAKEVNRGLLYGAGRPRPHFEGTVTGRIPWLPMQTLHPYNLERCVQG